MSIYHLAKSTSSRTSNGATKSRARKFKAQAQLQVQVAQVTQVAGPNLIQKRFLLQGHLGHKLKEERTGKLTKWDEIPQVPLNWTAKKFEKDRLYREIGLTKNALGGLFTSGEKGDLLKEYGIIGKDQQSQTGYDDDLANSNGLNQNQSSESDDIFNTSSSKSSTNSNPLPGNHSLKKQHQINEALRMYRILRPDAPSHFFEEESMLRMEASVNAMALHQQKGGSVLNPGGAKIEDIDDGNSNAITTVGGGESGSGSGNSSMNQSNRSKTLSHLIDPYQSYLPVIDNKSYLLALYSITNSLCDDLELILGPKVLRIYQNNDQDQRELKSLRADPLRFEKLVIKLFNHFKLKKDPSFVDDFLDKYWEKNLKHLIGPASCFGLQLSRQEVGEWLRGHLTRVNFNQREGEGRRAKIWEHQGFRKGAVGTKNTRADAEYYTFSEDFLYDSHSITPEAIDERNIDFPLQEMGKGLAKFLNVIGGVDKSTADDQGDQFQETLWRFEKLGLRDWIKQSDFSDQMSQKFPSGPMDLNNHLDTQRHQAAKFMLRCAARGKTNLLDLQVADPYSLLHGLPYKDWEQELSETTAENEFVTDDQLNQVVDDAVGRLQRESFEAGNSDGNGKTVSAAALLDHQINQLKNAGPLDWSSSAGGWRWKEPKNVIYDTHRKLYVKETAGTDPLLRVDSFKQVLLEMRRMGSMCRAGRIYYYRVLVLVGNGRGVYGFGIGFGNTPKDARKDAATKALQNLTKLDLDDGRMLCTPSKGKEYKQWCKLMPRQPGKGILANKKFLPLLYLLGLDNCKMSFFGKNWIARTRAIQRALDAQYSRRTMANATGEKYAAILSPGDHWIHWSDSWFDEIRASYLSRVKAIRLRRKQLLGWRPCGTGTARHGKARYGTYKRAPLKMANNMVSHSREVKPGWSKHAWMNPMQKWIRSQVLRNRQAFSVVGLGSGGVSGGTVESPSSGIAAGNVSTNNFTSSTVSSNPFKNPGPSQRSGQPVKINVGDNLESGS